MRPSLYLEEGFLHDFGGSYRANFIGLRGKWRSSNIPCAIFNIYRFCNPAEKRQQWSDLLEWKSKWAETVWCLGGDFNVVRMPEERRGINQNLALYNREMEEFENFILGMELPYLSRTPRCWTFRWPERNSLGLDRMELL